MEIGVCSNVFVGVFVERRQLNMWVFVSNNRVHYLQYAGNYLPVLETILYTVQVYPKIEIIDGSRLWNSSVCTTLFPGFNFMEKWTPEYYCNDKRNISPECKAWLDFDAEFHLSKLVPNSPLAHIIASTRTEKKLEMLVYKFLGVNSMMLKRMTTSQDLILDAYNLEQISMICKQTRKVWLDDNDCVSLLVDSTPIRESLVRLIKHESIQVKFLKEKCFIALHWAAVAFDKRKDIVVDLQHSAAIVPVVAPDSMGRFKTWRRKESTKPILCNPWMAVDYAIDNQRLPLIMFPSIKWTYKYETPNIWKNVCFYSNKQECVSLHDYVQQKITACGNVETVLTFSVDGFFDFSRRECVMCRKQKETKGEISFITCVEEPITLFPAKPLLCNPGVFLLGTAEIAKQDLLRDYQAVSYLKFTDLPKYFQNSPDVLVAIFEHASDARWMPWIQNMNCKNKILLKTFK